MAGDSTTFRVVQVDDVTYDFEAVAGVVVLREAEGRRRAVRVPVALHDATAVHHAWRRVPGRRPTSAELVITMLQELQCDVIAVRLTRYEAGVFYAELDLMSPRGRVVLDCRPSDALSWALRQAVRAPVLCAEELLGP